MTWPPQYWRLQLLPHVGRVAASPTGAAGCDGGAPIGTIWTGTTANSNAASCKAATGTPPLQRVSSCSPPGAGRVNLGATAKATAFDAAQPTTSAARSSLPLMRNYSVRAGSPRAAIPPHGEAAELLQDLRIPGDGAEVRRSIAVIRRYDDDRAVPADGHKAVLRRQRSTVLAIRRDDVDGTGPVPVRLHCVRLTAAHDERELA